MKIKLILSICSIGFGSLMHAQDPIALVSFTNSNTITSDGITAIVRIGTPISFTHIQDGIIVKTGLPIFFQVSDTTSVDDLPLLEGIQVFPNPIFEKLTMKRKDIAGELSVIIYNSLGQSLLQIVWQEKTESLHPGLTDFPPGAYFITVTNEDRTKGVQYKVIKN